MLKDRIENIGQQLASLEGEQGLIKSTATRYEQELSTIDDKIDLLAQEKALLQLSATAIRTIATEKFCKIVTAAIRTILQDNSEFVIRLGTSRNVPIAQFLIRKLIDGAYLELDPRESKGGGVVDIITLGLQIVTLEVLKRQGILMADEPLKHLSPQHQEPASQFLAEISLSLGRQMLIPTHKQTLTEYADNVIELYHNGHHTIIEGEEVTNEEKI